MRCRSSGALSATAHKFIYPCCWQPFEGHEVVVRMCSRWRAGGELLAAGRSVVPSTGTRRLSTSACALLVMRTLLCHLIASCTPSSTFIRCIWPWTLAHQHCELPGVEAAISRLCVLHRLADTRMFQKSLFLCVSLGNAFSWCPVKCHDVFNVRLHSSLLLTFCISKHYS